MSLDGAELAPEAKSALSISKQSTCCNDRSRNSPAPLIPPPIISTLTRRCCASRSRKNSRDRSVITRLVSIASSVTSSIPGGCAIERRPQWVHACNELHVQVVRLGELAVTHRVRLVRPLNAACFHAGLRQR